MRNTHFAANRSNIHDASFGEPAHLRQGRQGNVHLAPEVDPHGFFKVGETLVFDRANRDDAGIIHYYIDGAKMILDFPNRALDLSPIRDICNEGSHDPAGFPLNTLPRPHQFLRIPRTDCDLGSAPGELLCHGQSESTRSPGDKYHLAFERKPAPRSEQG